LITLDVGCGRVVMIPNGVDPVAERWIKLVEGALGNG
jgi:hypothetical protein